MTKVEDTPPPDFPLLSITSRETINKCKALKLRRDDVFVCSYPKSGTTWTQFIVLSLLIADKRHWTGEDISFSHVSDFAPFYDIDAHWETDGDDLIDGVRKNHERLGRRVFNTHLRWEMLPKRAEAGAAVDGVEDDRTQRPECGKFIHVTRNLIDVVASFYHHLSNQKEGQYTDDFETFAREFMAGTLPFGSPLDHLVSFARGFSNSETRDYRDQSLLLINYERMTTNLRGEVLRIMRFLDLSITDEVLEKDLLPSFRFDSMKCNSDRFQPKSVTWLNGYKFLRKGKVGDGRALMEENIGSDSRLIFEFDEWIQRSKYCDEIERLLGLNQEDSEDSSTAVFLSLVRHD